MLLILAWFCFGDRNDAPEPTVRRHPSDDVDHAELEQAERDVRDADDEDSVRDWGPGAGPRPPHQL